MIIMNEANEEKLNKERRIYKDKIEGYWKKFSDKEQVYTIALFDILGFSSFVEKNKMPIILDFYQKVVGLIEKYNLGQIDSSNGMPEVVPVPIDDN